MAGRVVTIAQQKGGAGKTTLAAHLAVAWREAGHGVVLADIDPQGSLTRWFEARARTLDGAGGLEHVRTTGWRTQREVERLADVHDLVLIDSPPHAETEARIAVRSADLVLVPVQPSPMDLWATRPTLDLARQEGAPVLLVLNRVPSRARIVEELGPHLAELEAEVADSRLGNRTSFAASLFDGRTATETARRSRAAEEVAALAREVLERMRAR